ncbi:hypothetical protein, partial [Streptomyces flavidovirens]
MTDAGEERRGARSTEECIGTTLARTSAKERMRWVNRSGGSWSLMMYTDGLIEGRVGPPGSK